MNRKVRKDLNFGLVNSSVSSSRLDFVFCSVGLIHGDMNQVERNEVITSFKNKAMPILVATDVAGQISFLVCFFSIWYFTTFSSESQVHFPFLV